MAQLTEQEILEMLTEQVTETHPDHMDVATNGSLVIHTCIYRWSDGTYHNMTEDLAKQLAAELRDVT